MRFIDNLIPDRETVFTFAGNARTLYRAKMKTSADLQGILTAIHDQGKGMYLGNPFSSTNCELFDQHIPEGLIASGIESLRFRDAVRVIDLYQAIEPLVEYQRNASRAVARRYAASEPRIPLLNEDEEDGKEIIPLVPAASQALPNLSQLECSLKNLSVVRAGLHFSEGSFAAKLIRDGFTLLRPDNVQLIRAHTAEYALVHLPRLELVAAGLDYL